VRRFGKSYAHPLVVLVTLQNQDNCVRIGVTASHLVGNAVNRNRAKRRIRASVDEYFPVIQTGWDLIFLARRSIGRADFMQIKSEILSLLKIAGLLVEVEDGRQV
jgi:ribonuclease P protein component